MEHKINGKKLKQYRMDHGYSLTEIAEKTYTSPSTVRRWESDDSLTDLGIVMTLCELYQISINDLFEQELPSCVCSTRKNCKKKINPYVRLGLISFFGSICLFLLIHWLGVLYYSVTATNPNYTFHFLIRDLSFAYYIRDLIMCGSTVCVCSLLLKRLVAIASREISYRKTIEFSTEITFLICQVLFWCIVAAVTLFSDDFPKFNRGIYIGWEQLFAICSAVSILTGIISLLVHIVVEMIKKAKQR